MKIILIAIGNEILSGHTVNTHASFLSLEFLKKGYIVNEHRVIPDDKKIIMDELKEAFHNYDLVLVTGGLGPTVDDKTKEVIAELFSSPLKFNETIYADLLARYPHLKTLKDQARIPEKASYFKNTLGTAYGMALNKNGKYLISLPGVPQEMKEMFLKEILPFIEKNYPLKTQVFERCLFLSFLEEVEVNPTLEKLEKEYPHVQIGIYPSYGFLQVRFSILAKDQKEADKLLNPLVQTIQGKWKEYIYSETSPDISLAVHEEMLKRKDKIALAESCTGGLIASSITQHSGSSSYFLGSIVAYSNEWKKSFLDVKKDTLENYGAVSQETVKEMLEGIFKKTNATWAIAISGIAGPTGATPTKPIGTLCIGVAKKNGKMDTRVIHVQGTREIVTTFGKNFALAILYQKLKTTP